MACEVCWAGFSIVMALFAYYAYNPMPKGAKEPMKQLFLALPIKIIQDVIRFIAWTGYKDEITCQRALGNFFTPELKPRSDESLEVSDITIDGVGVRLYKPRHAKETLPGIIYIHGGGWVIFSSKYYDPVTRQIAKEVNAVVISIDYRLAPEHPYPEPLDDCVKAAKYFTVHAAEFGVDPERIAISGDSAGGNLAMSVLLKLQADVTVKPCRLQVLFYPALQIVDLNTPSYQNFGTAQFQLSKSIMVDYWVNYVFGSHDHHVAFMNNEHTTEKLRKIMARAQLPDKYRAQDKFPTEKTNTSLHNQVHALLIDKFISPLLSSDDELGKIPKTYIMTCEYDVLRDDGFVFAERLRRLNIPVTHQHWKGVQHGFICPGVPLQTSKDAVKHAIEYLKSEL